MLDQITLDINRRFFEAFDKLAENGAFVSKNSFYAEYGVDKRNLTSVRTSDSRRVEFRLLSILVARYKVSAHWLLTGEGEMFDGLD